jgi:hypothetical protein
MLVKLSATVVRFAVSESNDAEFAMFASRLLPIAEKYRVVDTWLTIPG